MSIIVRYNYARQAFNWIFQDKTIRWSGRFSAAEVVDLKGELFDQKILPSEFSMDRDKANLGASAFVQNELIRAFTVMERVEPSVGSLPSNFTDLARARIQHAFKYLVQTSPPYIRTRGLVGAWEDAVLARNIEGEWSKKREVKTLLDERVLPPIARMIEDYASQFNDPD